MADGIPVDFSPADLTIVDCQQGEPIAGVMVSLIGPSHGPVRDWID